MKRYTVAFAVLILFAQFANAQPSPIVPPTPKPPMELPVTPTPIQPVVTQPVVAKIAAAIELPPDQIVSSKQRTVKLVARTSGLEVKWIVFNAVQDVPVDFEPSESGKSLRVFINDLDDLIIVFAYTAIDGKPSDAARTVITVRGQQQPNPTQPSPTPSPSPSGASGKIAAHISFVVDVSSQRPETVQVLNDASLQKFLNDSNVKLHSPIDLKSDYVTKGGLIAGVTAAGGAPCAIVQDAAGNIIAAVPLTSAQAVREMLKGYLRQ